MGGKRSKFAAGALAAGIAAASAFGAESLKAPVADNDEMTIAYSVEEKENAKRDRHVEFYKKVQAGDSEARQQWDALKGMQRTTILIEASIKDEISREREHALHELAAIKRSDDPEDRAAWALARVACAEKNAALRELAQTALTARRDECTPMLLTAALSHSDEEIRNNAIGAMKAMGGPRVFEVIIQHWHDSCGPGPHNHIFQGTQRSYVGDYDVAGAVYDPVIKSFLTGVSLDLKVEHIEGDIYYYAIREVAGPDVKLPNDIGAWQTWVHNHAPNLAQDAEKKTAAAITALAK